MGRMKSLLLAALVFFSIKSFSQSYVVMDNGIVVTTDSNGFTYDFGHYAFPQKITLKGGQYFVEDGNILATIDENGLLFRKYELIPEKIKGKGINYFLSEEGFLYMIDRKGFVKVTENELYKNAVNFGGNYFTVATDAEKTQLDLYVVTSDAQVVKADAPSLKVKDIVSFGGTYVMNNRGVVYTIAATGAVTARDDVRVGILQKKGGNYFVDSSGYFYTVSDAGDLKMPGLPVTLKVSSIQRLGSNYFIDQTGKLFVVDKNGNVFERTMRDHDFRLAKIISL
jgi:hypothetical protein